MRGAREHWALGTALAFVERRPDGVRARLQGIVTAMAYEAVHLRLAAERATRRELVLDHDALLAMTCRSAVEAALRGMPAREVGDPPLHLGVPMTRLSWALEYCLLMTQSGIACLAFVLDRGADAG